MTINEKTVIEEVGSPDIRLVHNFLTNEELESFILDTQNPEDIWELNWENEYLGDAKKYTGWKGMCILLDKDEWLSRANLDKKKYNNLIADVMSIVENKFNTKLKVESAQITRWRIGRDQPPHIDYFIESENHDYDELLENNWTKELALEFAKDFHTKHYSEMLYLNDNFEGGDLYFPQHNNFTLRPEPGLLAIFQGNDNNFHGVTTVTNGIRYNISFFFTRIDHESK